MNIIIVGGGKIIYFLSKAFIAKGHSVFVINRDMEECKKLSRSIKATIINGDGSDPNILESVGYHIDALLAVTPNDQDNLVICQLASQKYHISKTLALVNDPDNERVFSNLGITAAFSTTRILSNLIEQRTGFEDITNLLPLAGGAVNVTEVILRTRSPIVGMYIRDITLPINTLIATVLRENQPIVPRGDTQIKTGDHLIVLTLPDNHGETLKLITGDK